MQQPAAGTRAPVPAQLPAPAQPRQRATAPVVLVSGRRQAPTPHPLSMPRAVRPQSQSRPRSRPRSAWADRVHPAGPPPASRPHQPWVHPRCRLPNCPRSQPSRRLRSLGWRAQPGPQLPPRPPCLTRTRRRRPLRRPRRRRQPHRPVWKRCCRLRRTVGVPPRGSQRACRRDGVQGGALRCRPALPGGAAARRRRRRPRAKPRSLLLLQHRHPFADAGGKRKPSVRAGAQGGRGEWWAEMMVSSGSANCG